MGLTPTERYIQTFVDIARQQLRAHAWDEIEPALAVSWGELREDDTPPWHEVAGVIRDRCLTADDRSRAA